MKQVSEEQVLDPKAFIATLQEFKELPEDARGHVASKLSDAIIKKRVDLAEARQRLMDSGETDLLDSLNRLMDLIEPYIEESSVNE